MAKARASLDPVEAPLHGALGRALHLHIEGGIDVEATGVHLTPEPLLQDDSNPFGEVGAESVRHLCSFCGEGVILPGTHLLSRKESLPAHPVQDQVSPSHGGVLVPEGGVEVRAIRDGGQEGRLRRIHLGGILAEVVASRRLDSPPSMGQVDLVHVGFQDLVLGVGPFQLQRHLQFLQLPFNPLFESDGLEHVSSQLLGDGTPASPLEGSGGEHSEGRPGGAPEIDSPVLVEATVLDGDEGLGDMIGEGMDRHRGAPFDPQLPDESTVVTEDLGGLLRLPGVDLRDGRTVHTEIPPGTPAEAQASGGHEENGDPHPGDPADPAGRTERSTQSVGNRCESATAACTLAGGWRG